MNSTHLIVEESYIKFAIDSTVGSKAGALDFDASFRKFNSFTLQITVFFENQKKKRKEKYFPQSQVQKKSFSSFLQSGKIWLI